MESQFSVAYFTIERHTDELASPRRSIRWPTAITSDTPLNEPQNRLDDPSLSNCHHRRPRYTTPPCQRRTHSLPGIGCQGAAVWDIYPPSRGKKPVWDAADHLNAQQNKDLQFFASLCQQKDSLTIEGIPCVLCVLLDTYVDVENKDYGRYWKQKF